MSQGLLPDSGLLPLLALLGALAPGLLGFGWSRARDLPARTARSLSAASAMLSLALIAAAAIGTLLGGASPGVILRLPGIDSLSIGARLDGLSLTMGLVVALIGAVVARYAVRYLDGDPRQARFSQWLSFTSSSVLVFVFATNLVVLAVGWIAAGIGLERLLLHDRSRPGALRAVGMRRIAARAGDLSLGLAVALLGWSAGTLDLGVLLANASVVASAPEFTGVAVLLAIAAMAQSVQFPFHVWLPETMEAPTPVSAFMHAGLVNAGGMLLIRFSPLLVAAPGVLAWVAIFGAATAVIGALVMTTQTDIKGKYAYSTVSQMGFMMLQCGIGAFGPATLHLVGHSFYKGHAFLSAASSVDPTPPGSRRGATPHGLHAVALLMGVAVALSVAALLGLDAAAKPGFGLLVPVLGLGVGQMMIAAWPAMATGERTSSRLQGLGLALGAGAAVCLVYFGGVLLMELVLSGVLPAPASVPSLGKAWVIGIVALFVGATWLQAEASSAKSGLRAERLRIHLRNGLYLSTLQQRLLEKAPGGSRSSGFPRSVGGEVHNHHNSANEGAL